MQSPKVYKGEPKQGTDVIGFFPHWHHLELKIPVAGVLSDDSLRQSIRFVLRWSRFMRRIAQLKLTDWDVRTLVVVKFFAYFVAPSRWMLSLVLVCAAVVGVWALLCREGVLGWAKPAHRSLDGLLRNELFRFRPFVQNLFNRSRCDGQRQSPKKAIVRWR